MKVEEYLTDPCGASSLPYWKTETVTVPPGIRIVRDDAFDPAWPGGRDEPYFKLMHPLQSIKEPVLPKGYTLARCGIEDYVNQINACYAHEHLTEEELLAYLSHPVYREDLWVAVKDRESGAVVATGIAELDARIGEGILEWIQVLPAHRRKGLGSFLVCELLKRMGNEARFATVSGRMKNESAPLALYESCGFLAPVVWHVITEQQPQVCCQRLD